MLKLFSRKVLRRGDSDQFRERAQHLSRTELPDLTIDPLQYTYTNTPGFFSCGAAHLLRSQVAVIEFDVSNCGFDPLAATKNFLLRARKLATPNFRKVFCNKKIFSTPQKFFLRSQKTFSEKFLVSKNFLRKFLARKIISSPEEIFLLLQKFFLQLKKTFSEKFSDITHITRTCTRTSVGWFLFAHTAVCRKVSVICEENFFFTAIHRSQSRSDPVILLLRAAARNKEFLYVNCGLNDG